MLTSVEKNEEDRWISKSQTVASQPLNRYMKGWRGGEKLKEHREPIPKDIWHDATELAKKHSINTVSKTLRLSYTDLKDRVCGHLKPKPKKQRSSDFIEIGYDQPSSMPETTIEMENKKGSRFKICLKGSTDFDPMDLAKTF